MSTSRVIVFPRSARARCWWASAGVCALVAALGCGGSTPTYAGPIGAAGVWAGSGTGAFAAGSGGAASVGVAGVSAIAPAASAGTTGLGAAGVSSVSGRGASGVGAPRGGVGGTGIAGQGAGGVSGGASGTAGVGTGLAGAGAGGTAAGGGGTSVTGGGGAGGAGGVKAPGRKFVGNITTSGQVRSDFAMYWNQITPENEGKWGSVEATRNQMNWAGVDRVHDYAKQQGIIFKQHNFVWGSQQPSWLAGLSATDQAAEVEQWIKLFCERYPDVALIDVVNEPPPHTTPVYMNALGGAGASGYDWIVKSFKLARQYCPNAILILNDYNNLEYSADNTRFVQIVNAIKNAGAPIDAIGCQAHDIHKVSTSTVQGFLDKLTATGLPVYITEFDLDVADDNQQKTMMQNAFTLFWNDTDVHGITLWGYIVGATWRPNTGLMTSGGQQRPAMTWLVDFLAKQ